MRYILAAIAIFLAPVAALAQHGIPGTPTAAECEQWAQSLGVGGSNAMDALTYGSLTACPVEAPPALASAIQDAVPVSDTAYLWALTTTANVVMDPAVFDAAMAVAGNGSATDESRVMGLLVLAGQLEQPPGFNDVDGVDLFSVALPDTGLCLGSLGSSTDWFRIQVSLPVDFERRIATLVDRIRHDSGEPVIVRNLARCVRGLISDSIPPQVDVSGVTLSYVCGELFRVDNPTATDLPFTYSVVGTDEEGGLMVLAGESVEFSTSEVGSVELVYDGNIIHTVANSQTPCEPE